MDERVILLCMLACSVALAAGVAIWGRVARAPVASHTMKLSCVLAMAPAASAFGVGLDHLDRRWRVGLGLLVCGLMATVLFELMRRLRPHRRLLELLWQVLAGAGAIDGCQQMPARGSLPAGLMVLLALLGLIQRRARS